MVRGSSTSLLRSARLLAVTVLLLFWHPKRIWGSKATNADRSARGQHGHSRSAVITRVDSVGRAQRHRFCLGIAFDQRHLLDHVSTSKNSDRDPHNLSCAFLRLSRSRRRNQRFSSELALGIGNRNSVCCDHFRISHGLHSVRARAPVYGKYAVSRALFVAHHRRDAGAWLHHALLRHSDATLGLAFARHRHALSVFLARCSAGSASRSPARIPLPTCSSAACNRSPPIRWESRPS